MRKIIYGCVLVLIIVLIGIWQELPDGKFHIYFLDVGQGDAIFINTPSNHQILVDGGPGSTVIQRLGEVMPFFDKTIDLVVLTHPHEDHMAGLVEVVRRYRVQALMISGVHSESATFFELMSEVNARNITVIYANSDADMYFGDVMLDVLYPFEVIAGRDYENVNESSIVMKVLYQGKSILLSGDLERAGERELIKAGIDLRADIMKAGHHGSDTSSTVEFLREIMPEVAVIQAGKDNKFGHPKPSTIRNLYRAGVKKIYRNDLDGTVEFAL